MKRISETIRLRTLTGMAAALMMTCACVAPQSASRVQMERSPQQTLVYDNHQYLPTIRTVVFHPRDEEAGLPVLFLGQDESLVLSFDDLRADVRNYYYSIEHCNAEWVSSGLSPLEYAEGYNEDRIETYRPSVNTLQPYTHYTLEIPSRHVRPRLAGNYLLKVYEDADKRRLILTRRFYVVSPSFDIEAVVRPSTDNALRRTNQKLDVIVRTGGQQIANPYQDVRVLVLQNQRPDVQQWARKPSFIGSNEIRYQDQQTLEFPGGNEFRYVDLRSVRLASERMAALWTDSLVHVQLVEDKDQTGQAYGSVFDEDGAFFIRNVDRPNAPEESDYAQVTFSLDADAENQLTGAIYVVGAFNAYQLTAENRLRFDTNTKRWHVTLPLKQGLYDYEYVLRVDGSTGSTQPLTQPFRFSGSHYQTNNQYQILVYYRRPGTTWDEIRGYRVVRHPLEP